MKAVAVFVVVFVLGCAVGWLLIPRRREPEPTQEDSKSWAYMNYSPPVELWYVVGDDNTSGGWVTWS